jgi:hypothetical protein
MQTETINKHTHARGQTRGRPELKHHTPANAGSTSSLPSSLHQTEYIRTGDQTDKEVSFGGATNPGHLADHLHRHMRTSCARERIFGQNQPRFKGPGDELKTASHPQK